eukprot:8853000-Alexandrium_andersonii.AAC.1
MAPRPNGSTAPWHQAPGTRPKAPQPAPHAKLHSGTSGAMAKSTSEMKQPQTRGRGSTRRGAVRSLGEESEG